ncbi:hypothetical protein PUN28_000182 [Cardiocondyla obscurior]|uniref:Uncharacterized protein n=1 Tax=Cardiocondyla obscurior TaxID=286306 RepID=A0AAW2GY58_9HYME
MKSSECARTVSTSNDHRDDTPLLINPDVLVIIYPITSRKSART